MPYLKIRISLLSLIYGIHIKLHKLNITYTYTYTYYHVKAKFQIKR